MEVPAWVRVVARPPPSVRAAVIALAMPKSVTVALPAGEEDVVRLDVAVHDAVRVRVGEGPGDVAEDADHLAGGHRSLLEPAAQAVAVHIRHAEPGQPAGLAGGQDRDYVGMLQLGREQHFTMEALERDAGEQLRREHLHHDATVERLLQCQVGAGHAAAAQLPLEHVVPAGPPPAGRVSRPSLPLSGERAEYKR